MFVCAFSTKGRHRAVYVHVFSVELSVSVVAAVVSGALATTINANGTTNVHKRIRKRTHQPAKRTCPYYIFVVESRQRTPKNATLCTATAQKERKTVHSNRNIAQNRVRHHTNTTTILENQLAIYSDGVVVVVLSTMMTANDSGGGGTVITPHTHSLKCYVFHLYIFMSASVRNRSCGSVFHEFGCVALSLLRWGYTHMDTNVGRNRPNLTNVGRNRPLVRWKQRESYSCTVCAHILLARQYEHAVNASGTILSLDN